MSGGDGHAWNWHWDRVMLITLSSWKCKYPAVFTDSPPVPPSERRQTRVSCEQNAFPVCCRNKQRNFTTSQASCSRNTRRRWQSLVWKFWQVKLCRFDLNLSIKPMKKFFFVYICKLSLSLAVLYLVDSFINKLKTKFNNLFYRMILNTKRIHNSFWRSFPQELNKCPEQMPSKVSFVGEKKRRLRPFGHCAPKL